MGANIDAVKVASGMGISANRAANYHADSTGTDTNFEAVGAVFTTVRKCGVIEEDWKKEIDKDLKGRKMSVKQ